MTDRLRVLAVDATIAEMAQLSYLLETDPRVSSVELSSNADAAADSLTHRAADALFICVAHHTHGALANLAALQWRPVIVAMGPRPEYSQIAYDIGAVDFMLKPPTRESVNRALQRLSTVAPTEPRAARILASINGVQVLVDPRDILYIESDGDYTRIHLADAVAGCKMSMAELEERLRGLGFLRIHRRHLVATGRIGRLETDCGRLNIVVGNTTLTVARRLTAEVRMKLS